MGTTMLFRWVLSTFAIFIFGCASASMQVRPSRSIQDDFASIDELAIGEHRIDDPLIISRLAEIHARSKWDPVPITLPVGLTSIYGICDGERRFELVYRGWLWETNDDGEITRKATLSDEDRKWMEQNLAIFLPLPASVL